MIHDFFPELDRTQIGELYDFWEPTVWFFVHEHGVFIAQEHSFAFLIMIMSNFISFFLYFLYLHHLTTHTHTQQLGLAHQNVAYSMFLPISLSILTY